MKRKFLIALMILCAALIAALVVSSCGAADQIGDLSDGNDDGPLTAPSGFAYDGKWVKWDAVKGATKYSVSLNGAAELDYSTTSVKYDNAKGEDFTVTVTAKAEGKDPVTSTMTFSLLEPVSGLTIEDDGSLSWDEVMGADSYKVTVDSEEIVVTQTSYSDVPVGQHQVSVQPLRKDEPGMIYYSLGNDKKTITICENVDATSITYVDGVISWKAVRNAASYELFVNNSIVDDEIIGNKIDYDAHNGNFTVSLRAIGNHTNSFDSKEAIEKSFVYLEAPTDVRVVDGKLLWEPVPSAESYMLKVNGTVLRQKFTDCVYEGLRAGQETEISIRADSTDTAYYASWSDPKDFLILESPTLIWVDSELDGEAGESIGWNAVNMASGYVVSVTYPGAKEPVVYELDDTTRAYGNAYLDPGEYTVAVKCKAPLNSPTVCDSAYSEPIKVIRLAAPKAASTNFIKSYPDDVSQGFDVTFNSVTYATGYELYRDNIKVAETTSAKTQFARVTDFVDASVMDEQIYQYRIRSVGNGFTTKNRTAVLSSLTAEDQTLNFEITVLAMPSEPTIAGYEYSFGRVNKATKYTVSYGTDTHVSETTSYDLSGISPGTYNVRVNARGNEATVLSSNYTAPIIVSRLAPPENIRFSTEGSGGLLRFDEVHGAKSYDVIVNKKTINIDANSDENFSKEISNDTQLHVRSVANYFSDNDHYYMTSPDSETKFFTKLPIPTFGTVKFNGSNLVWNAITAFPGFSPSYRVYDEGDVAYENLKGSSMSMADFPGGQRYTFKIQAIGDGTRYINSDISDSVDVYKLPTPKVTIDYEKNAYKWLTVSAASSYSVMVDGKISQLNKQDYVNDYCFFDPKAMLTSVGEHTIEVFAVGDGIENMNSSAFTITQTVKQLELPEFTCSYSEASVMAGGKINVTVTKTSPHATAYSYVIGGVTNTTSNLTYSSKAETAGNYKVKIYAVGGCFGNEGEYYINSRETGEQTVVLLASPGGISIEKLGHLSWNSVSANYYDVELLVNGVDVYKKTTNTTSLEVRELLAEAGVSYSTVKTLKVSITARGISPLTVTSATSVKEFTIN